MSFVNILIRNPEKNIAAIKNTTDTAIEIFYLKKAFLLVKN
jgi:hypothetical protein